MNNGELDRLPVSNLSQRYSLVRSAVYTRMEALKIKPERVGNRAYVNAAQVRLLDEFHQFIGSGGTTAEFLEMRGLQEAQPTEVSGGLSAGQPDIGRLISSIVSEVVNRIQPAPEPSPLGYFEDLEKAARGGWELSTSELAYLLDLTLDEIQRYGDRFQDAGFVFTKVGYRGRGEAAWRVTKRIQ